MLLNVVLISKLLNNSLTSCSLINLDFGNTTGSTLDNNIVLLLLVFKTLGLKCILFCNLNKMIALFYTWDFKLLSILSFCVTIL